MWKISRLFSQHLRWRMMRLHPTRLVIQGICPQIMSRNNIGPHLYNHDFAIRHRMNLSYRYQESTFIPLNQDLHRSQSEMAALSFVRELGSALQPQLFPWIRSRVLRWSLPGQPCLVRHVTVLHTSKACVQIAVILGPSLRTIRTRVLRLNWVDGYLVAGV